MNECFEAYVFNVGHGDNILIRFSTGTWGLIDFHYTDDQNEPPSITYLRGVKGPIVIEFVHITHYHKDHTKGLDQFFDWLNDPRTNATLNQIWLPGTSPPDKLPRLINTLIGEQKIIQAAIKNKVVDEVQDFQYHFTFFDEKIVEYRKKGNLTPLIGGVPFLVTDNYWSFCMSPSTKVVNEMRDNQIEFFRQTIQRTAEKAPYFDGNTLSTILLFYRRAEEYKGIRFAFGGDATQKDWHSALTDYEKEKDGLASDLQEIYSAFIKASHHGSKHSSSEYIWTSLIDAGNPKCVHAFFSSGDLSYPNKETLEHIQCVVRNGAFVQTHATNKDLTDYNYYKQDYPATSDQRSLDAQERAAQYGRHRKKLPMSGLVAYKYNYDFSTLTATVTRLIRP
ncbi:hypothetical protein [Puia dinghuensis]|uniref:MBL fold metallo-hydrolase n=1 Tax=Puia dinghuensis TaxID=1792502 RepID=A0A8J2UIP2_9BACT|nr:hypothetical protein [Puia dinghuensis]GGB23569.1 hypothetical protein GCM10011511_54290 [Puia dinghuensis]